MLAPGGGGPDRQNACPSPAIRQPGLPKGSCLGCALGDQCCRARVRAATRQVHLRSQAARVRLDAGGGRTTPSESASPETWLAERSQEVATGLYSTARDGNVLVGMANLSNNNPIRNPSFKLDASGGDRAS